MFAHPFFFSSLPPNQNMDGHKSADELLEAQHEYWKKQDASVDGMLGGLGFVHGTDVEGSMGFLDRVLPKEKCKRERAMDCGGGIGRVTKHLLIPAGFQEVDILDVSQEFLDKAQDYVGSAALKNRYCSGLAQFDFAAAGRTWNCIWVQWCAIYLTDAAFVQFFKHAAAALADEHSVVVLKENVLRGDSDPEPDHQDK